MKKLAAFIILFVYLAVSTGFVVSVHWCMNKVDSVVLGDVHSEECGKCGMHMANAAGCCKDDVKLVKMTADQKPHLIACPDFSIALLSLPHFTTLQAVPSDNVTTAYPYAHGPPLSRQDTYLRNCVFRI